MMAGRFFRRSFTTSRSRLQHYSRAKRFSSTAEHTSIGSSSAFPIAGGFLAGAGYVYMFCIPPSPPVEEKVEVKPIVVEEKVEVKPIVVEEKVEVKPEEEVSQGKAPKVLVGVICGREADLFSAAPIMDKAVKPEEVDMVLFHGGCPDGFASAFVAYLALGTEAEYIGIAHGKHKRLPNNIDGKMVAVCDFSFDSDTMADLVARAKGVIVLDHHASAEEALQDLPDVNKVFEMKQSGATLAWDFFHPAIPQAATDAPLLLRYIEDKDIWRWALHNTRAFDAARDLVMPVPRPGRLSDPVEAFKAWQEVFEEGDEGLAKVIEQGSSITCYQDKIIQRAVRGRRVRRLKAAPEHKAYLVNSTVLGSEIGNELSKKGMEEDVSYAIVARYNPGRSGGQGRWSASLRSLHGSWEGAADVSLIAKHYGGGGHRAAAGMGADVRDLEELFVEEE